MAVNPLVVDLHLHSRFSMGTSPALDLKSLAAGARLKGIDLLAAPDYTHPDWLSEMRGELEEIAPATYRAHGVDFVLVTEISCVYRQGDKGRRIHVLVAAPGLEAAERFSQELARFQNLRSDGRPTVGIAVRELANIAWDIDEWFEVIPAHIWTPWYGLLGSRAGFDSIDECFGEDAARINAVETGLSSDPAMNWNVPAIGNRSIVSFSDAHSPGTMGRELTILDARPSYRDVVSAVRSGDIVETVEFHPEHGKYHFDGHRKCNVRLTPEESERVEGRCPACGRKLTLGVLNRVKRFSYGLTYGRLGKDGLTRSNDGRPPFRSLVPLRDLLSFALGVGPTTKKVTAAQSVLLNNLGSELHVLTQATLQEIATVAGQQVAGAIGAVRQGAVVCEPGFDGQYGVVRPAIQEQVTQR